MSQNTEILAYLKSGKRLTQSTAVHHFRCYRLAARIFDLRRRGYPVLSRAVKRKSKRTGKILMFSEYYMSGQR